MKSPYALIAPLPPDIQNSHFGSETAYLDTAISAFTTLQTTPALIPSSFVNFAIDIPAARIAVIPLLRMKWAWLPLNADKTVALALAATIFFGLAG